MRRLATLLAAAVLLVTGACSTASSPEPTLAPALSNTEISQADVRMHDFGERYFNAWPISDEVAPQLADDATFTDPTSGDALAGKASITRMVGLMEVGFPDLDYRIDGVFLSADGALYELEADGLWPPFVPTPANHPPVGEIQATRVEGDLLKTTELAFPVSDLEMFPLGCFADHGCSDQYDQWVSDYVSAWSSGDAGKIAALYRDDAVFTDSLLGLDVTGAAEIGRLGQTRFGPAAGVSIEVLGRYAQTDTYKTPYSADPNLGAIIGVGVHYRATMTIDGQEVSLESFALLHYATFTPLGLDADPDGRIVDEQVFHDAESLASWLDAAGLAT